MNAPQCIGSEGLRLGIGQRYDLSFVMPSTGSVRIVDSRGQESVTVGSGPAPARLDLKRLPLFDPLGYGPPAPDTALEQGFDVTHLVVLGEKGGIRHLQPELIHTIIGKAAPMGTTYPVRQGQVVRLQIVNETKEFHTMHPHGHALSLLNRDGLAPRGSPVHLPAWASAANRKKTPKGGYSWKRARTPLAAGPTRGVWVPPGPANLLPMKGRFAGWKGDFQGFFLGLQADNSKAYFESRRRQYEQEVKGPMIALLADLEPEFGPARLSRPNRDIRFSADKSPYKTNIYADAPNGGYVALDASGLVAAGGRYMMETPQLARFREATSADTSGKEIAAVVAGLREKGYEVGGQELKRVPPPHAQDHPRGDLLRHKRLIYWRRWEIGRWIATAEARERVAQVWRDGAELNAWLAKHVDGG